MGQKSNTLTLRTNKNYLKSYALNSKGFLNSNEYVMILKRSLEKKGVIITSFFFETAANSFNLSLDLFFKTKKLLRYKKKLKWKKNYRKRIHRKIKRFNFKKKFKKKRKTKTIYKKQNLINKLKSLKKKEKLSKTFKNLTKDLPTNKIIIHNIEVLNRQISKRVIILIHTKLNYFKRMLFSRRFNLYYDFLKITTLFIAKKINLNVYNIILGTIFKFLTKKSHSKFFIFLKKLVNLLIKSSAVEGIKININGKLKGKLRAKPFKMVVGKIGTQTITSDINFSKVHIHTLYGCFGLKTWIKYK